MPKGPSTMKKRFIAKVKSKVFGVLQRVADRIHPRNSSGNNTSKM